VISWYPEGTRDLRRPHWIDSTRDLTVTGIEVTPEGISASVEKYQG